MAESFTVCLGHSVAIADGPSSGRLRGDRRRRLELLVQVLDQLAISDGELLALNPRGEPIIFPPRDVDLALARAVLLERAVALLRV